MPRAANEARTCAACGEPAGVGVLVRWFQDERGATTPDWSGKSVRLGGRGANLHARPACMADAARRNLFARSFQGRAESVGDLTLRARLLEVATQAWFSRLGLALRAGQLVVGSQAVLDTLPREAPGAILFAHTVGGAVQAKVEQATRRWGSVPLLRASGDELGHALGRTFVATAMVRPGPFADDLARWATALAELGAPAVGTEARSAASALADNEISTLEAPPAEERPTGAAAQREMA